MMLRKRTISLPQATFSARLSNPGGKPRARPHWAPAAKSGRQPYVDLGLVVSIMAYRMLAGLLGGP